MKERILIVDDEVLMLELLGAALEHEGYSIAVARDAGEAMAKISAQAPDLIILDVMLPRVSGLELCQQLRTRPETSTTPIIMLSAKGEVSDKIAGLQAGADEYVVKPIDMRELLARVEGLLERIGRMRAEQPAKAAKLISFIGAKGGVGTTTTTLNVAMAMSGPERNVLAVEFRPHPGSLSTLLGLKAPKGLDEILAMEPAAIHAREVSSRLQMHPSGLRILCAPRAMDPELRLDADRAESLIEALSGVADYVLLDLPQHPLTAVEAGVGRSAAVVVMTEPVWDSVVSAAAMVGFVRAHAGPGAEIQLVLVTRAPLASPVAMQEIQSAVGLPVRRAIPPAVDELARAQRVGMPIVQGQPDSFVAQAYRELAAQLL
jgi:DNA-binding response OmpR family regulator